MAQKVKKKYIDVAAVDASKILFLNNQILKSESSSGGIVDIFKVNQQNKIEFLDSILASAGIDANSVVIKSQMESAISSESSVRQSAESVIQGNIDAEALLRASEDIRILGEAKDYADAQDVINLATAKAYCENKDAVNLALAKAYADQKAQVAEDNAKAYAEAQDALKLVEAKSYADGKASDAQSAAESYADGIVSTERSRAMGIEAGLRSDLDTEVSAAPVREAQVLADSKSYTDGKISQEVSDRNSAIASAVAPLAEKTYVDTQDASKLAEAKSYADQKMSDEQTRAMGVESGLDSRIQVLEADPTTKSYVDSKVGDEQSARQLADQGLSNRISVLEQDPTTKSYVDGLNSAEMSAREAADMALSGRLAILESDPTTKSYVDAAISGLINGAPGALDTLKEIADQLANDESAVSALTNTVANNLQSAKDYADAGILVEKNRAEGVESGLNGRISVLEQDPTTKTYVDGKFSDASSTAHSELEAAIAQEVLDRNAAILVETGNRESADSILSGRLDVLEQDPTTKSYVDGKFSSEKSDRQAADVIINGRLDALENDEVKKTYVDSQDAQMYADAQAYANSVVLLEKNRAEGVESSLRSDLNSEISNAQAREAQVLLDAKAYSDIEKNARISDVNSLDIRISVLEEDPTTKSYVDGKIAQEHQHHVDAEAALSGRLDTLEFDPTTKSYVDSQISALAGSGGSAVTQVANDLAQEIIDRQNAVNNEASLRIAGDSSTLASAQAYADQKISELVNSAPGMLDTLKELADAIGDDPNFAATVASQVNDVHNEVMALKNAIVFRKESFVLSSGDMSNGYIEMSYEAASNSMNAFTEGLAIHEGFDYSLSVVGGKTRMSLDSGDFASGDKVFVQYYSKLV